MKKEIIALSKRDFARLERDLSKTIGAPIKLRPNTKLKKLKLGKLIKVCPGGRKAWYETSVGPVRKPYMKESAAV